MAKRLSKARHPKLLVSAVVLVVIAAGVIIWLRPTHKSPGATTANHTPLASPLSKIDYSPSTKQDNAANDARKGSQNPSETLDNGSSAPSASTTINPTIVNASVSNGNIHVGTLVSGTTSGNCTLTFSQAGQTSVVHSATVQQDVNDYDCGVFNVSTAELPSGGQWTVTLSVTNGSSHGSTNTQITI